MSLPAYSPHDVLRRVDNQLLAAYAKQNGLFAEIKIEELKHKSVEPILEAILKLDTTRRDKVHTDLRNVSIMADKRRIQMLFTELTSQKHSIPEFQKKRANSDKAMWALINHPSIFAGVLLYSFPTTGRHWQKFPFPAAKPSLTDRNFTALQTAIVKYFQEHDGRGELCKIEHNTFQGKEYLFAYPSDYPDMQPEWVENGKFEKRAHRPAFLVIFVFSKDGNVVDVYSDEPLNIIQDIFAIWAKTILNLPSVDAKPKKSFNLQPFYNRDHGIKIPANSPIKSIVVHKLRFAPAHNPKATYTVEVNTSQNAQAIYDELDKKRLGINFIKQAGLRVKLQFADKPREVRFDVSPQSCSLGHEDDGSVIRQFLKTAGIDVTS